ncbi:MAG: SAV_6107 family HEPN domain-containing protein [Gemmatimonadota bacterium]
MLRQAANEDLKDAATVNLSPSWSFNIAYNAALRLCTVVLAAEGYRPERDNKHYRTIGALKEVLGGQAADLADYLDRCRGKRHDITYEGVRNVSAAEADELIAAVRDLQRLVAGWITKAHPDLARTGDRI